MMSGTRVLGGTFVWVVISDHNKGTDYALLGFDQHSSGGACDSPVPNGFATDLSTLNGGHWKVTNGSFTTKP